MTSSLLSRAGGSPLRDSTYLKASHNFHPEYLSLKNTFLLPHIGSATIETRTAMGMLALDNVDAVLSGGSPPTLVRPLSQFGLLTKVRISRKGVF